MYERFKKRYCHSVPQNPGRCNEPIPVEVVGLQTSGAMSTLPKGHLWAAHIKAPSTASSQALPSVSWVCSPLQRDHSHRGAATRWFQGPHPKNHPVPETWLRRCPGRQQQQDRSCLSLAMKRGLPHSKSFRMGPGGLWDRHKTCSRLSQRT